MRIIFLLIVCTILTKGRLVIKDANMASVSRDDIGMMFYIAIHNSDNCHFHITVRMVKCIEEVDAADRDCDIMQLIGGDMGILKPQCSKNITLLYPNMYLHNRKGYCIIAIRFETEDKQILEKKTNISYNTIISKNQPVPYLLRGYYKRRDVSVCDSVDLDPLKSCQPVDCHMKYVGTRSYFNHHWRRCQKVPKCIYDTQKKLPDVGYTPITNKCLNLEKCITKADIAPLENKFDELTKEGNKFSALLTTLNCHFGTMNNETGVCDCLAGWDSEPFDIEPNLFTYHMCNVERISWYDSNRSMVTFVAFFIAIAAVAVAMVVVILSFILYHVHKCLKSFEAARKPRDYMSDPEAGRRGKLGDPCVCPDCPEKSPKGSIKSGSRKSGPVGYVDSDANRPSWCSPTKWKLGIFKDKTDEQQDRNASRGNEDKFKKRQQSQKRPSDTSVQSKHSAITNDSRKRQQENVAGKKEALPKRKSEKHQKGLWKLGTFDPGRKSSDTPAVPWKLGTFSPGRKNEDTSVKSKQRQHKDNVNEGENKNKNRKTSQPKKPGQWKLGTFDPNRKSSDTSIRSWKLGTFSPGRKKSDRSVKSKQSSKSKNDPIFLESEFVASSPTKSLRSDQRPLEDNIREDEGKQKKRKTSKPKKYDQQRLNDNVREDEVKQKRRAGQRGSLVHGPWKLGTFDPYRKSSDTSIRSWKLGTFSPGRKKSDRSVKSKQSPKSSSPTKSLRSDQERYEVNVREDKGKEKKRKNSQPNKHGSSQVGSPKRGSFEHGPWKLGTFDPHRKSSDTSVKSWKLGTFSPGRKNSNKSVKSKQSTKSKDSQNSKILQEGRPKLVTYSPTKSLRSGQQQSKENFREGEGKQKKLKPSQPKDPSKLSSDQRRSQDEGKQKIQTKKHIPAKFDCLCPSHEDVYTLDAHRKLSAFSPTLKSGAARTKLQDQTQQNQERENRRPWQLAMVGVGRQESDISVTSLKSAKSKDSRTTRSQTSSASI